MCHRSSRAPDRIGIRNRRTAEISLCPPHTRRERERESILPTCIYSNRFLFIYESVGIVAKVRYSPCRYNERRGKAEKSTKTMMAGPGPRSFIMLYKRKNILNTVKSNSKNRVMSSPQVYLIEVTNSLRPDTTTKWKLETIDSLNKSN